MPFIYSTLATLQLIGLFLGEADHFFRAEFGVDRLWRSTASCHRTLGGSTEVRQKRGEKSQEKANSTQLSDRFQMSKIFLLSCCSHRRKKFGFLNSNVAYEGRHLRGFSITRNATLLTVSRL